MKKSTHLFLIFLFFLADAGAESVGISKPGCPSQCGQLTVPYPFGFSFGFGFGLDLSCSMNPFFALDCDASFDPPKAFLTSERLEVISISEAEVRVKNRLSMECYDEHGTPNQDIEFLLNVSGSPFRFSNKNKLTVVGCGDAAFLSRDVGDGETWPDLISSCVAICSKPEDLSDGFCSGIGCCQSAIPEGLQSVFVYMETVRTNNKTSGFSSCGYSFLAETSSYSFNVSDISDTSFVSRVVETVPVVIDWAIDNRTCGQAGVDADAICQANSVCVDSGSSLGGYRCRCLQGYEGNPYLSPGCQDINECDTSDPCHQDAKCHNLQGSFNCSCRLDYTGDGLRHGNGCLYTPPRRKLAIYAGSLAGLVIFVILLISFWSYKLLKKRSIKQMKQNLFKRNGGLLLQQQTSGCGQDSVLDKMRIYTSKELEKATDKFNESRILGRGGQGTVYKGMLSDGRIVAVKKARHASQLHLEEFINEVAVQSEVNHRNVVKLLGCCLETQVPLLVYEFIPNGTLYHLIHDHNTGIPFTWDIRLRIATEVANALSYIHYSTSVPIYHRDMKSTNILLDEKYRAKLSDFGISRSPATDQTHLTTKVQGTFGYLDPEYFQTGKLTEKSDVYSFGVVLVELLTGQKPIETRMAEDEMSLVTRFLLSMDENRTWDILDSRITEQGVTEEHLVVAGLAKRCLNLVGKKRPKIREVVMELESIRSYENPSIEAESSIQNMSFTDIEDSWIHSDEFRVEI